MITMHIVGDGPRDGVTVPPLIETVLGIRVQALFRAWSDIRTGGYERKLKFAVRTAIDAGVSALVATVDTDKDRQRDKLHRLRNARTADPHCGSLVEVALGEATPHAEAWLLDDEVAVRAGLNLPSRIKIPTPRQVESPKEALEDLRRDSDRSHDPILEVLIDIARQVQPSRCMRAKETGFHALQEELRSAFRTHVAGCGEGCRRGDACSNDQVTTQSE
jgi:hypothetical protein